MGSPSDRCEIMPQETTKIDLGGSLLISQIAELHAQFTAACDEAGSIELDISRIERIDTAAMQLLCSLRRIDAAGGGRILWSRPSEAFMEAAGRLGMRRCFSFLESIA